MTVKELLHRLQQEKFDVKDVEVVVKTSDWTTSPLDEVDLDIENKQLILTPRSET